MNRPLEYNDLQFMEERFLAGIIGKMHLGRCGLISNITEEFSIFNSLFFL